MNSFDIEFFELINDIKQDKLDTSSINKKLLKLNNPTYYNRYIYKNPINRHGFNNTKTKHPILLAIQNMIYFLKIIKDHEKLKKQLQVEMAWAFNNFNDYKNIDL
jgi:hypothetical protein